MSKQFSSAALAVLLLAAPAWADVGAEARARARAGRAFEAGAEHFKRAEYAEAARAFLQADEIVGNPQALANAIASARKANDDLLVARASARAIDRAYADPDLASSARDALADAERRLVKLDLRCEPQPCSLRIDGEATEPGARYLLPGTHVLSAEAQGEARAAERMLLPVGTRHRVVLFPVSTAAQARKAEVESQRSSPAGQGDEGKSAARGESRPLPRWAFYTGVGLTGALAAVTVWSGLDALSAKDKLGPSPTQGQLDDVRGRMHRSDALFAGTLVMGAATAAAGLLWVDWRGGAAAPAAAVGPGAAWAGLSGRF